MVAHRVNLVGWPYNIELISPSLLTMDDLRIIYGLISKDPPEIVFVPLSEEELAELTDAREQAIITGENMQAIFQSNPRKKSSKAKRSKTGGKRSSEEVVDSDEETSLATGKENKRLHIEIDSKKPNTEDIPQNRKAPAVEILVKDPSSIDAHTRPAPQGLATFDTNVDILSHSLVSEVNAPQTLGPALPSEFPPPTPEREPAPFDAGLYTDMNGMVGAAAADAFQDSVNAYAGHGGPFEGFGNMDIGGTPTVGSFRVDAGSIDIYASGGINGFSHGYPATIHTGSQFHMGYGAPANDLTNWNATGYPGSVNNFAVNDITGLADNGLAFDFYEGADHSTQSM